MAVAVITPIFTIFATISVVILGPPTIIVIIASDPGTFPPVPSRPAPLPVAARTLFVALIVTPS